MLDSTSFQEYSPRTCWMIHTAAIRNATPAARPRLRRLDSMARSLACAGSRLKVKPPSFGFLALQLRAHLLFEALSRLRRARGGADLEQIGPGCGTEHRVRPRHDDQRLIAGREWYEPQGRLLLRQHRVHQLQHCIHVVPVAEIFRGASEALAAGVGGESIGRPCV